jgi:hydroxyacylglutathione hydrolase
MWAASGLAAGHGRSCLGPAYERLPEPIPRAGATRSICWRPLAGHRCAGSYQRSYRLLQRPCAKSAGSVLRRHLFSGGCGRLFEGTAAQMQNSWTSLPRCPATRWCAAPTNTQFPTCVLRRPWNQTTGSGSVPGTLPALRSQGQPTLPSTLQTELAINPSCAAAPPM